MSMIICANTTMPSSSARSSPLTIYHAAIGFKWRRIEKLVTLEPAGTVKKPTSVPPSVLIRDEMSDAMKLLHNYRSDVEWLKGNLAGIVKNAMEGRATENGNIKDGGTAAAAVAAAAKATELLVQRMAGMEKRSGHLLQFIPMAVCKLTRPCLRDWRHASILIPRIRILMHRCRRSTDAFNRFWVEKMAAGVSFKCNSRWQWQAD